MLYFIAMNVIIAVDVGGTQLRAASYLPEQNLPLKLERTATRHPQASPLEQLCHLIEKVWPIEHQVTAISIAAPGPLNPFEGIIFTAPNIPGWENLPIRNILQEKFQVPVLLGNDANLAALAEWQFGAGQGHHHLIYMTVSTGIGSGIIVEDHLLLGSQGLAAELGHVTVLPNGPRCGCGQEGHLEAVASGTAIAKWVKQELDHGVLSDLSSLSEITARHIAEVARQGDQLAKAAMDRAGMFIGYALADFVHIFNPTAIIIGGGVSRSGDLLMEPMKKALAKRVLAQHYLDNLTLTNASLGDEVGLLGALVLARSAGCS